MFLGTPEFKVGVLVVSLLVVIGGMSMKVANNPGILKGTKQIWFRIDDASGLIRGSSVKIAGINVGVIDDIRLSPDGAAQVYIEVRGDVPLSNSSLIEVRTQGILGDKNVVIVPGNPADPLLTDGAQIVNVRDRGSLDNVVTEINKITKSLGEVVDNLKDAIDEDGNTSTSLGRIVRNVEVLTRNIAEITEDNKEKFGDIVDNVHSISSSLDEIINDPGPEGLKVALKQASRSLARLDNIMKNVDEIAEKINKGEGTVGKLINDEKTVEELNTAISNVNDFLGGANKLETSIDFHSEYLASESLTKSYLGVRLTPGLDRYYELQVVDDPKGVEQRTETTTRINNGSETLQEETKVFKSKVKFSAQFAKNFFDFTVRGGLIENAGGFGIDYHMFSKKLRFSIEAFRFSDPYVRAFVRYNFLKGVYVIGGGDNVFAQDGEANAFFGAGIFLTNDDLKTFMSRISF